MGEHLGARAKLAEIVEEGIANALAHAGRPQRLVTPSSSIRSAGLDAVPIERLE